MKNFIIDFIYGLIMLIVGSYAGYNLAQPSVGKLRVQAKLRCNSTAIAVAIEVERMLDYQVDNKFLIISDYATSLNYLDTMNKNAILNCEAMNEQR